MSFFSPYAEVGRFRSSWERKEGCQKFRCGGKQRGVDKVPGQLEKRGEKKSRERKPDVIYS